ncbi:MAG: iron chelate uptake ABC transporter family permease subunit, partial [Clostridia bacterium]|nr:iron chelate uptake ABC transporter family permease subunit [Clostridia bacterium]
TMLIVVALGMIAAVFLSKPMGAYQLGEAYARTMGVNVKRFRIALVLLSSLLSACVTALAGPISFVGIAVPHITRTLLKSSKPAFVIPAAFLAGAVFCVFCDLIARTVFSPTELNIGTVTSIFGAPVVIWMMVNRRRRSEA